MDKNIYKFIFFLLFFASFESFGQIMFINDFENGQFGNWENTNQWCISSQSPIAGKYSLRHNVTGIRSSSYINCKVPVTGFNDGLVTWNFSIKNGNWIFGATEQFCFFLLSDKSDISISNGYAIGINLTGGGNQLTLCRMNNGKAVQEIVLTDLVWRAGMALDVEVTHEYGLWKLRYKEVSAQWSPERTGNEKLMNFLFSNIGILYKFNTTHGGQLWIDNVSVRFDNKPPLVHEIRSIGRNKVFIIFSEPISPATLLFTDNYKIKTEGGFNVEVISVTKASGDTAGVYLQLGTFNQWNLQLTISNLTDMEGIPLSVNDLSFTFIPSAQFGDIVFNEVMADPSPVVKLPNAEYIELKNNSGFTINLLNWILEINGKQKLLSDKTMGSDKYLIVSGTGGNGIFGSFGANLEVSGMTLANAGVNLKLYADTKVLIDSFSYYPAMHRKGFVDGGYSLERIDPMRKCNPELNWETSKSENGGTPGIENSVFRENQDNVVPEINSVTVASPSLIEIIVSEMPDSFSISGKIFSCQPMLSAPDSIRFDRNLLKYYVYFPKGEIKNGIEYTLKINGLTDECGNAAPVQYREFWYYLPKQGDLLINEVLFNPFPDGVDFVEIYNNSGRKIELAEIYLGSRDNNLNIKSVYPLTSKTNTLFDAQYAAFTSDSALLLTNYNSSCAECIYKMTKFPPYNLDEGWVVLMNKEMVIIDEFHYVENMHNPMIADVKGISLERNSFSKPTNDRLNWHSASKTVGFATPGYCNSTKTIASESSEIVTFEPKIFSPNGDGFNDKLLIRLSLGEPDWMVNIRIYNENGIEIRRLANNLMIGTQDVIEWDGTTENHQKVGLGIYIIKVELFGREGQRKQYKAACILTDRLK